MTRILLGFGLVVFGEVLLKYGEILLQGVFPPAEGE